MKEFSTSIIANRSRRTRSSSQLISNSSEHETCCQLWGTKSSTTAITTAMPYVSTHSTYNNQNRGGNGCWCSKRSHLTVLLCLGVFLLFFQFKLSLLERMRSVGPSPSPSQQPPPPIRSFPKWGRSTDLENRNGIAFQPIRNFILSQMSVSTADPKPVALLDHSIESMTQLFHLPEILYIIQPSTVTMEYQKTNFYEYYLPLPPQLYMSNIYRQFHQEGILDKLNHTERIMLHAIQHVLHGEITGQLKSKQYEIQIKEREDVVNEADICLYSAWPTLCKALYPTINELVPGNKMGRSDGNGFPFFAWYGDYTGCNFKNWVEDNNKSVSIPTFTVAVDVNCDHTMPFPNYYHIKSCMKNTTQWDQVMDSYKSIYPFNSKIPQVVWRGSLTGKIFNNQTKCPRWNMVQAIKKIETKRQQLHPNNNSTPSLFDVKITKIPKKVQHYYESLIHDIGIEHYGGEEIAFLDFQKYRSILDIDGHSWSGRFGSLLCFNSIVLKVDPQYVDYFHAKREPSYGPMYSKMSKQVKHQSDPLQAWQHYIPVRSDFSNLEEVTEYVLDADNDKSVQQIIKNANDWCRTNMIEEVVAYDMLTIWDRYVQLMSLHDENWSRQYTDAIIHQDGASSSIFTDSSLQMLPLHLSDYRPYENKAIVPISSNV